MLSHGSDQNRRCQAVATTIVSVPGKTTLGARVEEAIRRSGLAHNEFSRASGVSTPVLSRLKADTAETAGKRSAEELAKVARVGGVDLMWLAMGVEPKASALTPQSERYPSKAPAARAMRGILDDDAIEAMLSEEHYGSTEDPGAVFWMTRAKWWHEQRAKMRKPGASGIDGSPPLEPRPKKKKGTR